MLTQQQFRRAAIRRISSVALGTALLASPSMAAAQDPEHASFVTDVAKHVVFDPTTYIPAIIGYDATMRDWNSSQPFFQHGFVEHNAQFTVSGMPNDRAVSYGVGRQMIARDFFANLEISLVNNVTDSAFERVLIERHPDHRKLVRTIGWIEKNAFAAFLSYRLSAIHYQQWQQNERLAQQLGYK
ncbi:MAG TPA: hypothetical protein VGJ29_05285 [Vicinamibacterales bacterium]|jgi:hypothetical protein